MFLNFQCFKRFNESLKCLQVSCYDNIVITPTPDGDITIEHKAWTEEAEIVSVSSELVVYPEYTRYNRVGLS